MKIAPHLSSQLTKRAAPGLPENEETHGKYPCTQLTNDMLG